MKIQCPNDLNQFIFGEPLFDNTFPEEECEQRKFYGDCYHCFGTAITRRDHQLKKYSLNRIKTVVDKWKTDTWTDNFSYECMSKIADILAESEENA